MMLQEQRENIYAEQKGRGAKSRRPGGVEIRVQSREENEEVEHEHFERDGGRG
jgi:hypothetical protein